MPPCNLGLFVLGDQCMRRTPGIKNKIRTRVARREKPSDRLPPQSRYMYTERSSEDHFTVTSIHLLALTYLRHGP
jgi:hypothetical protein